MYTLEKVEQKIKDQDYTGKMFSSSINHIKFIHEYYPEEFTYFQDASLINLLIIFSKKRINTEGLIEALQGSLSICKKIKERSISSLLKNYNYLYHHGLNYQKDWEQDWKELFPNKKAFNKKFEEVIVNQNQIYLLPRVYFIHEVLKDYNYTIKSFEITKSSSFDNINISYIIRNAKSKKLQEFIKEIPYSLNKKYKFLKESIEGLYKELFDCCTMYSVLTENNIIIPKFKVKTLIELHDQLTNFYINQQVLLNNEPLNSDYSFIEEQSINNPITLFGAYKTIIDKGILDYENLLLSLQQITGINYHSFLQKNEDYALYDYLNHLHNNNKLKELYKDFQIFYPQRGGDLVLLGHDLKICVGSYVSRVINKQSIIVALKIKENSLLLGKKSEHLVCVEYQTAMEITSIKEVLGTKQIRRKPIKGKKELTQIKSYCNQYVHSSLENYFKELIKADLL